MYFGKLVPDAWQRSHQEHARSCLFHGLGSDDHTCDFHDEDEDDGYTPERCTPAPDDWRLRSIAGYTRNNM